MAGFCHQTVVFWAAFSDPRFAPATPKGIEVTGDGAEHFLNYLSTLMPTSVVLVDKLGVYTYPVFMANITLSVDENLIQQGRQYAKMRGTSLNALVRNLLADAVSKPDSAVDAMIESLRQSPGDSKGRKIIRQDLHRH